MRNKEIFFDIQFKNILSDILNYGCTKHTRTGYDTLSLFNTSIDTFDLLENGKFPLISMRKYFFKGALTELFWILGILQVQNPIKDTHRNNIAYLKRENVDYWDKWADEKGNLGDVYGEQLMNWDGSIDQINDCINKLRTNPDDRRMICTMWNPSKLDKMALPPCHYAFEFYSEPLDTTGSKRRLQLRFIQRSADMPVGVPYDIAMYSLLLFMVSKMTNHIPGTVTGLFGDSHIYDNQVVGVKKMLDAPISNMKPPTLVYTGPEHVENLNDFQLDWFNIENYNPYKDIKIPVNA